MNIPLQNQNSIRKTGIIDSLLHFWLTFCSWFLLSVWHHYKSGRSRKTQSCMIWILLNIRQKVIWHVFLHSIYVAIGKYRADVPYFNRKVFTTLTCLLQFSQGSCERWLLALKRNYWQHLPMRDVQLPRITPQLYSGEIMCLSHCRIKLYSIFMKGCVS